jgi:hypothetical protein
VREVRRRSMEATDAFEQELLGSWRNDGPSASRREESWAKVAAVAGIVTAVPSVTTASVTAAATQDVASTSSAAPPVTAVTATTRHAALSRVKWVVVGALVAVAATEAVSLATRVVDGHGSSPPAAPVR